MRASKDAHVLIPRICDYVILYSKMDFAGMIKDLEIGRLSWVIRWHNVLTSVLIRGRQEGWSQRGMDSLSQPLAGTSCASTFA